MWERICIFFCPTHDCAIIAPRSLSNFRKALTTYSVRDAAEATAIPSIAFSYAHADKGNQYNPPTGSIDAHGQDRQRTENKETKEQSTTTATNSFHGTRISLFQQPNNRNSGTDRRENRILDKTPNG